MERLTGERGFKPFECVGTVAETRKIIRVCVKKEKNNLPIVLREINKKL